MKYNIVPLSISNGLDNKKIAGSFDYIILLKAPTNANVRVRLNDNTASEIPLNNNFAISAKNVTEIFISADAVQNGIIVIGQSDRIENFQILTAPIVDNIGEIGNFSEQLLGRLDKLYNPYDLDNIEILSGGSSSTSLITLIDDILDCDRIIVNLTAPSTTGGDGYIKAGSINLQIDGQFVSSDGGYFNSLNNNNVTYSNAGFIKLDGVRGKNIKISSIASGNAFTSKFYLQKISRKV